MICKELLKGLNIEGEETFDGGDVVISTKWIMSTKKMSLQKETTIGIN